MAQNAHRALLPEAEGMGCASCFLVEGAPRGCPSPHLPMGRVWVPLGLPGRGSSGCCVSGAHLGAGPGAGGGAERRWRPFLKAFQRRQGGFPRA